MTVTKTCWIDLHRGRVTKVFNGQPYSPSMKVTNNPQSFRQLNVAHICETFATFDVLQTTICVHWHLKVNMKEGDDNRDLPARYGDHFVCFPYLNNIRNVNVVITTTGSRTI